MKIMNTLFTDHLGVGTRSSFQSQCHAIETLAMQPRRVAEEPNSVGVPRGATTPTQVYPNPPFLIVRVTSQQSGHGASSLIEPTERASPVIEPKRAASLIEPTEQVGASPTIKRAAPLIEPTERASPVVELHASIVTDRAQVGASPTTMRASSLIEPRLELRQRPSVQHR